MELSVTDGTAVIAVRGDLDIARVKEAEAFVEDAFRSAGGVDRYAVDLSEAGFLDSMGLGLLVSVRVRCQELQRPLVLRDVPGRLQRVLVLSGLDGLFDQEHTGNRVALTVEQIAGVGRPAPFELPDRASRPPAPDERLDRIAELTRRAVDAPQAFVILVDKQGQVVPGRAGAPEEAPRSAPLRESICQHVVTAGAPLIVPDTRASVLLGDNPASQTFQSYAGMPLTDHTGRVVGSLCVTDSTPREWSQRQLDTLADLAEAASSELQLRTAVSQAAVAADRERFAQTLNEEVFGELLSLSMLLGGAQSITTGRAGEQLADAVEKVDDIVRRLRSSLFDRD